MWGSKRGGNDMGMNVEGSRSRALNIHGGPRGHKPSPRHLKHATLSSRHLTDAGIKIEDRHRLSRWQSPRRARTIVFAPLSIVFAPRECMLRASPETRSIRSHGPQSSPKSAQRRRWTETILLSLFLCLSLSLSLLSIHLSIYLFISGSRPRSKGGWVENRDRLRRWETEGGRMGATAAILRHSDEERCCSASARKSDEMSPWKKTHTESSASGEMKACTVENRGCLRMGLGF